MRLSDFYCPDCRTRQLDVPEPEGIRKKPMCCGRAMRRLPGAPALANVKRFSPIVHGREKTVAEIDRDLAKDGSYVASETERRAISDMAEGGLDPVIVKSPPGDSALQKAVGEAMRIEGQKQ